MERGSSWEYKTLIGELTQGMKQAHQLSVHLRTLSSSESRDLLHRIMSSYEKALLILNWNGSVGEYQFTAPISGAPDSPFSVNGSPRSDDFTKCIKDHQNYTNLSKKRKALTTWTEQVRVSPDSGLEGPGDDGYSWRKYGQKDILGAKYPRSYYRCTYRQTQNCWATKQVQRSDDDPSVFEITHKGTHTCNLSSTSVPPPPSPEKQEVKQCHHHDSHDIIEPNQMLTNLRANLRVDTDKLENEEKAFPFSFPPTFNCVTGENQEYTLPMLADDSLLGTYTPSFISPTTPESNYFSSSSCQMNRIGEPADMFSASRSSTNSPTMGMEFSIDDVGLDPNFPFDTPGYFTSSC